MKPARVFLLDTGGCGACAAEVWATVELSDELVWAPGPGHADVVVLTGSITPATREAVLSLYLEFFADQIPVVAVGRCAVDGYPFGQGGVRHLAEIEVARKVEVCPPLPSIILETLLHAVRHWQTNDAA